MNVSDFDYELPEELIAQRPADKRDGSRLLVVDRKAGSVSHEHFSDVKKHLKAGDCLVINDSKVLPARLYGTKAVTGAKVEFLLTKRLEGDTWETMVRPGKRLKPGDSVDFADGFRAHIDANGEGGTRIVTFEYEGIFMERLEEIGSMPLPPYIDRAAMDEDKDRYQTVYAEHDGSVAAPTAGLHFTEELLEEIEAMGVKIARVTLHVGIGTFRPVKAEKVEDHHMHFEEYSISEENAKMINDTLDEGGRIVAVGTTSTRTLESAAVRSESGEWRVAAGDGSTGIFIYPGYEFKIIGALITNFHLPKSTLMMLISAFYDREKILKVYEEAVRERYRFFSYGDAMMLI